VSEDFRDEALSYQGRTLLPKINQAGLNATRLPLPPLPEQRRIVAKLDRLSVRSRAARDHLARIAKLATRAKQAILAGAFDATLAEGECGVSDLLSEPIRNGLSMRGNDHPPGVAALRLSALREGTVNLDDVRFLPITADKAAPYRLRAGDVLVSRGNGNLRLLAIASIVPDTDGLVIFPDTAFRIRISPSAGDPRWFALMWSAPQVRSQVEGLAKTTAGIWKVSQADLRQVRLPRIAPDAQRQTADRVEAAFARIDRLTAEAARAAHLVDRLDERLLAKAFRGALVPQDPADEPAEALLARVRAVRADEPKTRRGRRARELAS
jgi:type I restriction enzyme S subunit